MLVFNIDRDEIVDACNVLKDSLSSKDSRNLSIFATDSYIILSVLKSKIWIQKILLPVRHTDGSRHVEVGELSFNIDSFTNIVKKMPSYILKFRETSKFFGVSCDEERGTHKIPVEENFEKAPSMNDLSKYGSFSASFLIDETMEDVFSQIKKLCARTSSLLALSINENFSEFIAYDGKNSLAKISVKLPHIKLKRYGIFGMDLQAIKMLSKFNQTVYILPTWMRIYRGYSSIWADDMNFTSVHAPSEIDSWNAMRKTFNSLKPSKSTRENKISIDRQEMKNILDDLKPSKEIVMNIHKEGILSFTSENEHIESEAYVGKKSMKGISIPLERKYLLNVIGTLESNTISLEILNAKGTYVLYIADKKKAEHLRMLDSF